jgi:uncharacterized protein (TIGR01370 family)
MHKRMKQLVAALLCLAGCAPAPRPTAINHWAVYYDDALPASAFKSMDLVVFDRRHYPKFDSLKGKTIVLAYVSIGEVYDDVPERKRLEKEKSILNQNDRWKSHVVDVTSPVWRKLVMGYVDDAAKKGFDGVMLDTIDSPLYWADTIEPQRVEAMRAAASSLITGIRAAHPNMKIMVNRGFSILPVVATDIDYILAESIMTNTNVSSGQFVLFPPHSTDQVARQLRHVVALAPQLQVFTLDYWNQDDVKGLERIYASQRAEGFTPYVTTPDLTRFTPEPSAPREPS